MADSWELTDLRVCVLMFVCARASECMCVRVSVPSERLRRLRPRWMRAAGCETPDNGLELSKTNLNLNISSIYHFQDQF